MNDVKGKSLSKSEKSSELRNSYLGSLYIILSGLLFGLMPLITKYAYSHGSNAYTAAFGRFLFGSAILFIVIMIKPGCSVRTNRTQLVKILGISVFYAFTPVMLYSSYNYISSGLATTLHFTYPVAVIIIMAVFFRSKLGKKQIVCTLLCAVGIVLLYTPGGKAGVLGMIIAVASGIMYSLYIVLLGKSGLNNLPLLTLSFWLSFFSAIEIGITALLSGNLSFSVDAQGITAEVLLALCATVFALALFQKGLFLCGEVKASLLSTFEPLTGVVVGIIAFHESMTVKIFAGIVFILLSVILLVINKKTKTDGGN